MAEDGAAGNARPAGIAAAPARVAVVRLDVTDFRSYAQARIETDGRPLVLTGPNGAGKTNLLEALSFLAPGRGLRRARLGEIDRRPAPLAAPSGAWAVAARLMTPAGAVMIGTGRDGNAEGDRRLVRIDGQSVKGQTALAEHLNLVWLTPQMDRLFQEGAAPRRRFLDRLVFGYDPGHAARLSAYEQALRERAKLLRQGGADPAWLAVLEDRMAREGVAVAASRRDIVQRLDRASAESDTGDVFPVPHLALVGAAEGWLADMPALAAEDRLRAELAQSRRIDAESGGAVVGPHRADLAVTHAGKAVAAEQCSTGEQKALLVAIVLAHARLQAGLRGVAPVLLLDEVAAHLDSLRRGALFEHILALGSQAWLTGTDAILFAEFGAKAHFFTVIDGMIETSSIAPGRGDP
jgi:DNA replication and repair protein RecF